MWILSCVGSLWLAVFDLWGKKGMRTQRTGHSPVLELFLETLLLHPEFQENRNAGQSEQEGLGTLSTAAVRLVWAFLAGSPVHLLVLLPVG